MISIILPTYNEAENIVPLIEAIDAAVKKPHEVIVVDDNSPDGTWKLIEDLMKTKSHVRLERRMSDRGLTKSLKRGIELSQGDILVWMDCDFSMPPEVIPELLAKLDEDNDIAVASRFVEGGSQKTVLAPGDSKGAVIMSTFGCFLMRALLFPSFRDYTSGFIAIRKTVLDRIPLRGDYGEYFIDLIVRAKLLKFRIAEIPFACIERRAGESKTAPTIGLLIKRCWQYGIQILKMEGVRLKHLLGFDI